MGLLMDATEGSAVHMQGDDLIYWILRGWVGPYMHGALLYPKFWLAEAKFKPMLVGVFFERLPMRVRAIAVRVDLSNFEVIYFFFFIAIIAK